MSVPVVALAGLKGGVGRTTLTAGLAAALAQAGRRCLAVDLDPQNGLGPHFGRGGAPGPGIADLQIEVVATERREAGRGDPAFVPFGRGDERDAVEERLASDPSWLSRRLAALTPPGCELVFVDAPAQRGPWLGAALETADLVLVPVTPEPASYATLPATEDLLRDRRGGRPGGLGAHYVINRFDAASTLRRDVAAALRASFGPRLAPVMVHEDQAVQEALGRHHTVFREATQAQVIADLSELADWVHGLLYSKVEGRPRRAAGARS